MKSAATPDAEPVSPPDGVILDDFAPTTAADDRQAMISLELHHRVQNTLAIVLALARLTARSVETIAEFQVAFGDRIQAMARTNALLLRGHAQAIDVLAALEVELEPYTGPVGQVTLACDHVTITADAALSLSLMLHELATNAAKYGALSAPAGTVSISWTWDEAQRSLRLIWTEQGGPQVSPPATRGFGSRMIERGLKTDLDGGARLIFAPGGVICEITARLDPTAADTPFLDIA